MTAKDMKAAVERIKGDPDFARRVHEKPEEVLLGKWDLDPAQWQALHRALVADVEDTDDVSGFQLSSWGTAMEFPHLDALVSRVGPDHPIKPKHIAGVKYEDITISEKR